MRYSYGISLILLLLSTSGLATLHPQDQKWVADVKALVLATPAITANGTVYVGAGSKLLAISAQGSAPDSLTREPQSLYEFPGRLLDTSPAVSPDGHYLYLTYAKPLKPVRSLENIVFNPEAVFATFDLRRPDLVEPIWSYSQDFTSFSAPTADTVGNVFVIAESSINADGLLSKVFDSRHDLHTMSLEMFAEFFVAASTELVTALGYNEFANGSTVLKIGGNKASPWMEKVEFSNLWRPEHSSAHKKLGPSIYNTGKFAGGVALAGKHISAVVPAYLFPNIVPSFFSVAFSTLPDLPYLFKFADSMYPYLLYTSFEKVKSWAPNWLVAAKSWLPNWYDYYYYHNWGSYLQSTLRYSVPVIDNNANNLASRGTICLANSNGDLEAYQGNLDNYKVPRKWSQKLSKHDLSKGAPVIANDGTVYIGDPITGALYAVNYEKNINQEIPLDAYGITMRPAVDNKNDLVYVVDTAGNLYAVDVRQYTLLWSQTGIKVTTAPVVGEDGTVVVGTADGKVLAYRGGRASASQ